jgi:hypothetical protein
LMGMDMNCHLSHLVLGLAFIWPVSAEWSGICSKIIHGEK